MTDITPSPSPAESPAPQPEHSPEARSAATFDVLPLSREMRETLAEIGYTHPTPVQIAVWDPATRGKDAVVQARTGTGKTAAFGLPIVDHIVRRSQAHVQTLVLCPTRELANQVASEVERLGKRKNVRVVAIYGGAPMQRQIDQMAEGAQVVVGTPGRVLDHLRRGTLDPRHIRLLVLDESDEMLSMGFEREVTAILDALPKDRQTLLFSATVPPDIERMAKKLRDPEFITLSGDHIGALEIAHFVYLVASDKPGALLRIIEVDNPESAIIFCNTRDETERVAQMLVRQGFDADWLNGDLAQDAREKVMAATREGRLRFLVATDVAARGIDISHLTHVINYDFPQDSESYVHRTGRTGRAGRTGTAISLIMPQDIGGLYLLRLTFKIRPIEKQVPSEGELKTRAETDLVAMLAEAFGSQSIHPQDLSLARRLLTHEERDIIVAGLLRDHLGARASAGEEAATARRASRPAPVKAPETKPRVEPPAHTPTGGERNHEAPVVHAARAEAPKSPVAPKAPPQPEAMVVPAPRVEPAAPVLVSPPAALTPQSDQISGPEVRAELEAGRAPRVDTRENREGDDRRPRPRQGYEFRRTPMDRRGRPEARSREELGEVDTRSPRGSGGPAPGGAQPSAPRRHSDFVSWQPPEEEGDDEPILGHEQIASLQVPLGDAPRPEAVPARVADVEGDFAEIYVNVGRREGARAVDIQRLLTDRAGLDRSNVRRIRVRERNSFVSVRREDLQKAVAALCGASIGGRTVSAEQARERVPEGEASAEVVVVETATDPALEDGPPTLARRPADPSPAPEQPAPDTDRGADDGHGHSGGAHN